MKNIAITGYRLACLAIGLVATAGCPSPSLNDGGGDVADSGSVGVVPADLRDVERDGEGLVSTTFGTSTNRTPDWTRAQAVLGLLTAAWGRVTVAYPNLPAPQVRMVNEAITSLTAAISAQRQQDAVVAANRVGLACPELFDYFHPSAPIQVIRMDAVFRQIGIDAHFGDWTGVTADLMSLHSDWTAARGSVDGRVPTCHRVAGTATVAGDIDASLTTLDTAAPAHGQAAVETESDNGALEVDTLELLFDCPPDNVTPTHGVGAACHAGTDCDPGLVCDPANAGGRCAPDPAHALIGTVCTSTAECGTDSRSACNNAAGDGYPGGYCFMEPCNDIDVCPPGATCVAIGGESPGCFKTCTADTDCRTTDGYVCQLFVTAPPHGYGPSDHACAFRCMRDSDCGSPLTCDVASGRCRP